MSAIERLKIEKGIPIPKSHVHAGAYRELYGMQGGQERCPFDEMQVGDSFAERVPVGVDRATMAERHLVSRTLAAGCSNAKARSGGRKRFVVRLLSDECRVWRVS